METNRCVYRYGVLGGHRPYPKGARGDSIRVVPSTMKTSLILEELFTCQGFFFFFFLLPLVRAHDWQTPGFRRRPPGRFGGGKVRARNALRKALPNCAPHPHHVPRPSFRCACQVPQSQVVIFIYWGAAQGYGHRPTFAMHAFLYVTLRAHERALQCMHPVY